MSQSSVVVGGGRLKPDVVFFCLQVDFACNRRVLIRDSLWYLCPDYVSYNRQGLAILIISGCKV